MFISFLNYIKTNVKNTNLKTSWEVFMVVSYGGTSLESAQQMTLKITNFRSSFNLNENLLLPVLMDIRRGNVIVLSQLNVIQLWFYVSIYE